MQTMKDLAEKALMMRLKRILGREPIGGLDFVRILTSPDVLEYTKKYIQAVEEQK